MSRLCVKHGHHSFELLVRFRKGYWGNREEPGEPDGYDVRGVYVPGYPNDLTDVLADSVLERLRENADELAAEPMEDAA